jgi:tRNA G46 methylase TrmB
MLKYLPNDASTILEIGSGNGCFIKEIKKTREGEF